MLNAYAYKYNEQSRHKTVSLFSILLYYFSTYASKETFNEKIPYSCHNVSERSLTASLEYLHFPKQFANLLSTGRQTLQQLSTPQQRKKLVNCVKEPPKGKMHILRLPLVEKTQLTSLDPKSTRFWAHLCGHSVRKRYLK